MEETLAETDRTPVPKEEPSQTAAVPGQNDSSDLKVTDIHQQQGDDNIKVKGLSCQLNIYQNPGQLDVNSVEQAGRLAKILKVIAQDKSVGKKCQKAAVLQCESPGPSAMLQSNAKPFRKAKHSWQVKNLSGQTSKPRSGPAVIPVVGVSVDCRSTLGEPPRKRVRWEETTTGSVPCSPSTAISSDLTDDDASLSQTKKSGTVQVPESSHGVSADTSGHKHEVKSKSRGVPISTTAGGQVASEQRLVDVHTRWQSRHVAQAIVDNAINATLEVLGISLASDQPRAGRTMAARRQTLEDDAVSVIIQTRGLQNADSDSSEGSSAPYTGDSQPSGSSTAPVTRGQGSTADSHHSLTTSLPAQPTAPHVAQLDPLISQLTHFSETMLARKEFDEVAIAQSQDASSCASDDDRALHVDGFGASSSSPSRAVDCARDAPDKVLLQHRAPDLDALFTPSLQTDVLDKAVSAAISQKGLAMDGSL